MHTRQAAGSRTTAARAQSQAAFHAAAQATAQARAQAQAAAQAAANVPPTTGAEARERLVHHLSSSQLKFVCQFKLGVPFSQGSKDALALRIYIATQRLGLPATAAALASPAERVLPTRVGASSSPAAGAWRRQAARSLFGPRTAVAAASAATSPSKPAALHLAPAGHRRASCSPASGQYSPASLHGTRSPPTQMKPGSHRIFVPPRHQCPAGHSTQLALEGSKCVLTGHEPQKPELAPPHSRRAPLTQVSDAHVVHSLLPVAFWKWPLVQLWQSPAVANVPVSHGLQKPALGPPQPVRRPAGHASETHASHWLLPVAF